MTAPAEPLKPSLEQARELDRLRRRVADLEDQLARCRRTVAEQQAEASRNRPRRVPLPHPRPVIRDVPTGGAL